MADLVGLRVKILNTFQVPMKYPDFDTLASVQASGVDWSTYIDVAGSGWLYEETGFEDGGPESPPGEHYGLILVPQVFADEAVAAFPNECTKLTVAETEDFYNRRHASRYPEEEIDSDLVDKLRLKKDLGQTLSPKQQLALDPRDSSRGIRPHPRKIFSRYCQNCGFNVVEPT